MVMRVTIPVRIGGMVSVLSCCLDSRFAAVIGTTLGRLNMPDRRVAALPITSITPLPPKSKSKCKPKKRVRLPGFVTAATGLRRYTSAYVGCTVKRIAHLLFTYLPAKFNSSKCSIDGVQELWNGDAFLNDVHVNGAQNRVVRLITGEHIFDVTRVGLLPVVVFPPTLACIPARDLDERHESLLVQIVDLAIHISEIVRI